MKLELKKIISLLRLEINNYSQLESLLIKQQNLLIEGNNEELDEVNFFIDEKCKELVNVKSNRDLLLKDDDHTLYLEELEYLVTEDDFERIMKNKTMLNAKIDRVSYLQSVNQMVLEHVLKYNQKRMRLLRMETDASYAKNGQIQKDHKRVLVDRSV